MHSCNIWAPAAGGSLKILVDKSKTVFAFDDNEHHMQLKLGLNKWEDIQLISLSKVTEVPNVQDVYCADVTLPKDLFAVDFVIQDYRTQKVSTRAELAAADAGMHGDAVSAATAWPLTAHALLLPRTRQAAVAEQRTRATGQRARATAPTVGVQMSQSSR
jgi:hypothetical protein